MRVRRHKFQEFSRLSEMGPTEENTQHKSLAGLQFNRCRRDSRKTNHCERISSTETKSVPSIIYYIVVVGGLCSSRRSAIHSSRGNIISKLIATGKTIFHIKWNKGLPGLSLQYLEDIRGKRYKVGRSVANQGHWHWLRCGRIARALVAWERKGNRHRGSERGRQGTKKLASLYLLMSGGIYVQSRQ
jgi:hypothetical protein